MASDRSESSIARFASRSRGVNGDSRSQSDGYDTGNDTGDASDEDLNEPRNGEEDGDLFGDEDEVEEPKQYMFVLE